MTSSAILGDWTHRRGDRGGSRAVAADLAGARPEVAWSWAPDHGGQVDQVRAAGGAVVVATMMPRDPRAPNWEHPVVYAIDAATGRELARRVLPDPAPVAAVAVDGERVHVLATRCGEPIFWYVLATSDLSAVHRSAITSGAEGCSEDVLDAWVTHEGGIWLELDVSAGPDVEPYHAYAFAEPGAAAAAILMRERHSATGSPPRARDACAGDDALFIPVGGLWSGEADAFPPTISRIRHGAAAETSVDCREVGAWARSSVFGVQAQIHTLEAAGLICGVAAAEEPGRPDRGRVEAFAIDRETGEVRWRAAHDRVNVRERMGDAARVARRPNGELLFQGLSPAGAPCTPLLCARDGQVHELLLGARGRYVLDAALGDLVLTHRETRDGDVEVTGFAVDHEGRLLGRRAVPRWSVDAGNLGGDTTVYAGAGAILVRGVRGLRALRV